MAQPAHIPGFLDTDHSVARGPIRLGQASRPVIPQMKYSSSTHRSDAERERHDIETGLHIPPETHHASRKSWPLQAAVVVNESRIIQGAAGDTPMSSCSTLQDIEVPAVAILRCEVLGQGSNSNYSLRNSSSGDPFWDSLHYWNEKLEARLDLEKLFAFEITQAKDYSGKVATTQYLEDLLASHPLLTVTAPRWWNRFRHGFFSMYRRLFALVLIANMIALAYCVAQAERYGRHRFSYPDAINGVVVNLLVGTLMRHEHMVNFLFRLSTCLPYKTPLAIRRYAAKVYSYGGIHSSCGISSLAWYIFYVVLLLRQFDKDYYHLQKGLEALTAIMLTLYLILICLAHPRIRSCYHDLWERSHRFAGWASIAIVWSQTIIVAIPQAHEANKNIARVLIRTPSFWFLIAITSMIIYPWLRLRRRKIQVEKLSDRAARLHFTNKRLTACVGTKLSHSPLIENHGFATIPNPDNERGYTILVSNAGDWTRRIINDPPNHLWTRGAPTIGVSRVGLLFRPLVVAATGSGIGPSLSFLQSYPNYPCRVVWQAPLPEVTFGKDVMAAVLRADPRAVIIDTKKTGRCDMAAVCYAAYRDIAAEAVVLISNPVVTKEVVFELECRGVPAYGAIFDS